MCLVVSVCMHVSELLRRSLIHYEIIPNPPSDRIGLLRSENPRETETKIQGHLPEEEKKSIWGTLPQGHQVRRAILRRLERPKDRLPEER